MGNGPGRESPTALVGLVVLVHLAIGATYQWTVPLFEAPDEPSHIQYVGFLAREHRLPLYGARPEVPGEGMQAPLYYALAAPLFGLVVDDRDALMRELHRANLWLYRLAGLDVVLENRTILPNAEGYRPGRRWFAPQTALDGLLGLRWLSRLLGGLAVGLTFFAARRASGDATVAVVAAVILGLAPQFLFVSGSVGNDAAAAAVGAAGLLVVARALHEPARRRRDYLWIGALGAVGLLTKTSTLPGLVVAGAVLLATDARPPGERVRAAVPGVALGLLLAAPYLGWNTLNRGDPLGTTAVLESAQELARAEDYGGLGVFFGTTYWAWTFESYWARFGWMDLRVPGWTQLAFFALSWTGALGFALAPAPESGGRALRRYLVLVCVASLAAHVWLNLQTPQPQGRHLFPSAPQLALLLALGWRRVVRPGAPRLGWPAASALSLGMAGLALYCLLGVIAPAYAAP